MKLINFTIAPPIPDTSFRPATERNDLIVSFAIQVDNEAIASAFAQDVMKTIDQYRK